MDDHRDDAEWRDVLEAVLEQYEPGSELERKAFGVASQALHEGFSSLSEAQQKLFNSVMHHYMRKQQEAVERAYRRDLLDQDSPP